MTFLDTGIMVEAVLKSQPEHELCLAALENFIRPFQLDHVIESRFGWPFFRPV
jgi:predicted nucleic acid-binding protein